MGDFFKPCMSEMSSSRLIKCGTLDKKSFCLRTSIARLHCLLGFRAAVEATPSLHVTWRILCLWHQGCHQVTPSVLATWWPFQSESSRSVILECSLELFYILHCGSKSVIQLLG